MVNITRLQDFIQNKESWKESNVLTFFSMPRNGITEVFQELEGIDKGPEILLMSSEFINPDHKYSPIKTFYSQLVNILDTKKIINREHYIIDSNQFDKYFYYVRTAYLLKKLADARDYTLIYFEGFEDLMDISNDFYDYLKFMLKENYFQNIKFIFTLNRFYTQDRIFNSSGSFAPYLLKNFNFVSGFKTDEVADALKVALKDSMKAAKRILSLTAGHTNLVEIILNKIGKEIDRDPKFEFNTEFESRIYDDIEVKYILKLLNKKLSKDTINIYFKVIKGVSLDSKQQENYLQNLNIIKSYSNKKSKDNFELLSKFLSDKNLNIVSKKSVEKISGLVINTDELSTQEYEVYKLFKDSEGKLVTKDQVAKAMWGKKKKGKKKDWAIDQLMKRLRDKIGDEDSSIIQTVRGRGYRFVV